MSWEAWGTPEYLDQPECRTCGGDGEIAEYVNGGVEPRKCPECDGKGFYITECDHFEDDVL